MSSHDPMCRPLALVFSHHPAPYRDPVLAAVHERGQIRLLVAQYSSECSTHPEWEWRPEPRYPQVHLGSAAGHLGRSASAIRLMRAVRPSAVVVPGLGHPTSLAVLGAAIAMRVPVIYSADTVEHQRGSAWSLPVREALLRAVLKRAASSWVPGRATRGVFESRGMSSDRIYEGCYCPDEEFLSPLRNGARAALRASLRELLRIGEADFAFLFVGAMIPQRRATRLVEAFSAVRARRPAVALVLVGGGPEHGRVAEMSSRLDGIKVVGPVPIRRLPEFYASCDVYVHPGTEPYSLAVAEAALAGLPVIATERVGATLDYVVDDETGFVIPENDTPALVRAMTTLAEDVARSRAMGARGGSRALTRNKAWGAEQLERAVRVAAARAPSGDSSRPA